MSMVFIKPLSVNKAWKGRRIKTESYRKYERDLMLLLPKVKLPKSEIDLYIKFGFSSSGSDIDNPVKPFVDILQKKYGFNDNKIMKMTLEKEKVKKGDEFICFYMGNYEK